MLSNESLKFEVNLRKNLMIFLKNSFLANSAEENEGGVEVMGFIMQIEQVFSQKKTIFKRLKFYKGHRIPH